MQVFCWFEFIQIITCLLVCVYVSVMVDRQPTLQSFYPQVKSTNKFDSMNIGQHHVSCRDSMVVNRKFAALSMKKNQPKNPIKAILAGIQNLILCICPV